MDFKAQRGGFHGAEGASGNGRYKTTDGTDGKDRGGLGAVPLKISAIRVIRGKSAVDWIEAPHEIVFSISLWVSSFAWSVPVYISLVMFVDGTTDGTDSAEIARNITHLDDSCGPNPSFTVSGASGQDTKKPKESLGFVAICQALASLGFSLRMGEEGLEPPTSTL